MVRKQIVSVRIFEELLPALQQVRLFSPLQSSLEVFKECFRKSNFEPCPLFDARECKLNSNQGNSYKSQQGSALDPKYVESSFFCISSARLLNVIRAQ